MGQRSISFLAEPDRILVRTQDGFKEQRSLDCEVSVRTEKEDRGLLVFLKAESMPVYEVVLEWTLAEPVTGPVLADHWERGYGDLCWEKLWPEKVMPWYFLEDRGEAQRAFGVKVRPSAMCWWGVSETAVSLHLDVRCGSAGVVLGGRELLAAQVLMEQFEGYGAFAAAGAFCSLMCTDSIYDGAPVYGGNNWYYAYGVSSREDILRDASYLAQMTEGLANRPFMVIDDGWQIGHTAAYNGGPWDRGNSDYGDMGRLAEEMKQCSVRPGIWFRPLNDSSEDIPENWRLERDADVLDISVPEVIAHVQEDVRRIAGWGYELIKHDFSTFDIFGKWGFQMGAELTEGSWRFRDASRTTAELITAFYRAIHEAAGETLILGCNCIGHLGAGLMQLNRTGDDTSGMEWERTKKMGVNTLAFRMPQHGAFYAVDADCAGITDRIDWEKNKQWLMALASSGTPLFVSVRPGTLSTEQEEVLRAAYRMASENQKAAEPLDWKETRTPQHWKCGDRELEFSW